MMRAERLHKKYIRRTNTYVLVKGESHIRPIFPVSKPCSQSRRILTFQTVASFQTQQTALYLTRDPSSDPQSRLPVPRRRPRQSLLPTRPHFHLANPPRCSQTLMLFLLNSTSYFRRRPTRSFSLSLFFRLRGGCRGTTRHSARALTQLAQGLFLSQRTLRC